VRVIDFKWSRWKMTVELQVLTAGSVRGQAAPAPRLMGTAMGQHPKNLIFVTPVVTLKRIPGSRVSSLWR
jgi:hypothetical protein